MLNLALIGIGYWGQKLRGYIEENGEFNLKHTCNSQSNLGDIWDDVDAVVIATPNETHYSLSRMALLNGKHVLVEKPPTLSFKECAELKSLARARNLAVMTDYVYTFSESLQKAKAEAQVINITLKRMDRVDNRDAYLVLGSHALSILDMFVPLISLKFYRFDIERKNGVVRAGMLTFWNKDIEGRILVALNGLKGTEVILYGEKEVTINPDEPHNLRHVLNHFIKTTKGEAHDNLPLALNISAILENLG